VRSGNSPSAGAAVDVKLDAMDDAAKTWHAQAPILQQAADAAAGPKLSFTAIEMGIAAPFHDVYASLTEDLGDLLKGASKAATVIGDALEKAAANYRLMESIGSQKLGKFK
jgi:hypothetical protein